MMAARKIRSFTFVLLPLLLASTLVAQQGDRFPSRKPPAGPTPRTAGGKPDFSGIWLQPKTVERGMPEMLSSAASIFKLRLETNLKDLPSSQCLPTGVFLLTPVLNKIVQTERLLVVLQEITAGFRQVFLDGRDHPKDLEPTWNGHSIGRWRGDTLVVETAGYNDRGWLDGAGHPRTEKLRVIEEFLRPDFGHLEIQTTIDDPGAYLKPWTIKWAADLAPDEEIQEFLCNENNQDLIHLTGK
jgi:hypothetical protein